MDSERDLIELASLGDELAFSKLFHLYKHKLYSFTLCLVNDADVAEDVVQDVFLRLWKNRAQLASIQSFGGYLFQTAKNQAINSFRRMASETLMLAEFYRQHPDQDHDTENILDFQEAQTILAGIISKLPPQQKLIYHLSRDQGLKHNEIAEQLQLAPSTVKNHLIQALKTIREQLRMYAMTICMLLWILAQKK